MLMLFGAGPRGALGGAKPVRSCGGYIDEGRADIDPGALAALGPVGILAGKVFGEVFVDELPPGPVLPLRGPSCGGIAPGEESRDTSLAA